jgi:hypothetical protein
MIRRDGSTVSAIDTGDPRGGRDLPGRRRAERQQLRDAFALTLAGSQDQALERGGQEGRCRMPAA